MLVYATINPGNFAAPSAPFTLYGQINTTIKFLRLLNNSPYQLMINLDGNIIQLDEFREKDIAVPPRSQGNLIITPTLVISSSTHAQASQLTIHGLVDSDDGGNLDAAIPQ